MFFTDSITYNKKYLIMVPLFVFFCNILYTVVDGTKICTEDTSVLFTNLSLEKPSNQSSTFGDGNASKGNDGNKTSDYFSGSCTHTSLIPGNHWWQVDLQDKYNVTSVTITNRDFLGERLHDFGIEASLSDQDDGNGRLMEAKLCHHHVGDGIGNGEERNFSCTPRVTGQYIRIYKLNVTDEKDPLTLCEVEVSGYKVICGASSTSSYSTTTVGPTQSPWTNTDKASSPSTTDAMTYPTTTNYPTPCNCRCVNTTTPNMSELVERVEQLKKQLTVNRKTTSSYIRKFTSAPDNRVSAQSIGVVLGAGVLIFVFGSIVAMDLPRLKHILLSK